MRTPQSKPSTTNPEAIKQHGGVCKLFIKEQDEGMDTGHTGPINFHLQNCTGGKSLQGQLKQEP